ncbi:MAG: hypothetical protein ABIN36_11685 [Ferruginibacter sp.]
MKFLLFILSILFILLGPGCGKYHDLKEKENLNEEINYFGQLSVANNLDSAGIPYYKPNIHLQISRMPDTVHYIFDSFTDSLGYYTFHNLGNGDYRIHTNFLINNVIYDSIRYINIHDDSDFVDQSWTINPSHLKQNGFVFTIRDQQQGYVNGCKIFLYSSVAQANADTAYNGLGASVVMPETNGYGKSVKLNIPAVPYVVQVKSIGNLRARININDLDIYGIIPLEITLP